MSRSRKQEQTIERPALDPDAREQQLIALAEREAYRQMTEGTASSQVIVHYLKLGSSEERLRKKLLEEEVKLAAAKAEAIEAEKKVDELYAKALSAMRQYSGQNDDENVH